VVSRGGVKKLWMEDVLADSSSAVVEVKMDDVSGPIGNDKQTSSANRCSTRLISVPEKVLESKNEDDLCARRKVSGPQHGLITIWL
jgi:hypothetical protein